MNKTTELEQFEKIHEEQLPVPEHKLHGWKHFAGLYAAEHVAATEFVIGATFVALGAKTTDILLGLLIGNILAVLSWTFLTAPIAVETRLSLYTYLNKIAGNFMSKLYDWANVIILYGAKEKYPEAEAKAAERNQKIARYQQQKAASEPVHVKDTSLLTRLLNGVAIVALGITLVLAIIVLAGSADESDYVMNRETFYFYGFICTLIYFVAAYWAMKRAKAIKIYEVLVP